MRSTLCFAMALVMLGGAFAGCLGGSNGGDKKQDNVTSQSINGSASTNMTNDTAGTGSAMDMSEQNKSLGSQPHIHDYWAGRERVKLMDQDVDLDMGSAFFFTFMDARAGTAGAGGVQVLLPDEAIVYEGTGKLEFTVTWSDPTTTGMGMEYRSAAGPTWSKPVDVKSGTPIAVTVAPEMCDMPHSKNSQWSFLLSPDQSGQVMAPSGKVHIRIDIVRMRDISLFPAHPDYWHREHTLTIFQGQGSSSQSDFASGAVNFLTGTNTDDGVKATGIVPMETMSMTGNLTIKNVQVELGKATNITLLVKPANSNNYIPAHLVKADSPNNKYWFAWLVDMRQTDAAYAKASNWKFDVFVSADPSGGALAGTPVSFACRASCVSAKVDYDLEVVAYDSVVPGAAKLTFGRGGGGNATADLAAALPDLG